MATAATMIGTALPALAAAPLVPTSTTFERSESHTPVLAATVADPDGGTVVGRFSARTAGAATWNLANSVAVSVPSGQTARHALPAVAAGTVVEWQVKSCEPSTGICSSPTAITSDTVSPMLGAGPRKNATALPFALGDRVNGSVDVGTGNLMVTATGLAAPGVSGDIPVDLVYNSLSLGAQVPQASTSNPTGYGWTVSLGAHLQEEADGSVVFHGQSGLTGTFLPAAGGAYTPPAGITADLVSLYRGGWTRACQLFCVGHRFGVS